MIEWFKTFRKTKPNKTFDVDELLRETAGGLVSTDRLSPNDREYIAQMVEALNAGARGVFVVVNADGSLDYLIANETSMGGIEILSRFIARHVNTIRENLVSDE